MKKLNKIVAVVLAAVMSVSLLACGGNKGASDKDAAVSSGDKVTINVYRRCFNLAEPDQAQVKKVEDAINAYIADKINVQIKLNDIASESKTRLTLHLRTKRSTFSGPLHGKA